MGHSARLHTVGADHLELGVDEGFLMRKHELALLAIRLQHSHAESLSDLSSDVARGLVNSVSILTEGVVADSKRGKGTYKEFRKYPLTLNLFLGCFWGFARSERCMRVIKPLR